MDPNNSGSTCQEYYYTLSILFQCFKCSKVFGHERTLNKHISTVHDDDENQQLGITAKKQKKSFECPICSKNLVEKMLWKIT